MIYHETEIDGILLAKVEKNIYIENIVDFENSIEEIFDMNKHIIALDMSNVEFASSRAIGILVRWMKKNRENGGDLVLLRVNDKLRKLLNELDIDKIINMAKDFEEVRKDLGPY